MTHPTQARKRARARQAGRTNGSPAAVLGKVLAATAAFALLHSALASRTAKAATARLVGARTRQGAYRAFFNTQAALTSAGLVLYIGRLPDRELYAVHGPAAALMRAGQAAGVILLLDAVRQLGVLPLTGIASLMQLARGEREVMPEPEAQGPALDRNGVPRARGAFLRSRHPLNLAPLPILWLNPRMTRNLAAFSAVATVYFWIGSWHEERRLLSAYGDAYRGYLTAGVPFFFGLRTLAPGAGGQRPLPRSPRRST